MVEPTSRTSMENNNNNNNNSNDNNNSSHNNNNNSNEMSQANSAVSIDYPAEQITSTIDNSMLSILVTDFF